jgi:molybdopterin-guanine dinucleotide biosynthesis protein A
MILPGLRNSFSTIHMMIEDCTAIVMAGGESHRMGQDKANLLWGEQTLLQTVTGIMQNIFPEVIISVRQQRPAMTCPQICDDPSYSGPLAGLCSGLANANTPWIFAIACDMPFITPRVVECLSRYRGGVEAVVPLVQGYPQPLAAFYAKGTLDVVSEILKGNGKHSFRAVLDRLTVRYVNEIEMREAAPASRIFFDLDTPHDMEQAMDQERIK